MNMINIKGKDKGKVVLYALSTCGWCKKTKALLRDLDAAYSYIDVDQLEGEEKSQVMDEVAKWNPACSFPTLVINGKCIVGFKDDQIKEALKG
jgi:glutaredoxin-like protein NrdH